MERITTNLAGTVKHAQLEGRDHLVVPMVMLTEGVHQGSCGRLYYPGSELAQNTHLWNHKPVVVYHPKKNGVGVSACQPDVLNTHKVGVILNTRFEDGKLKADAWVEVARLEEIDDRVIEALEADTMMELSTGLFTENEMVENGEWNGEEYDAVARAYAPDHLAILPDQKGACSIADGAGFLRINEAIETHGLQGTERILQAIGKTIQDLVANGMSDGNTRHMLGVALREKYNPGSEGPWPFVEEVYSKDGFFIYELDGKLWKHGFECSDAGCSLAEGESEAVVRVTEYRTAQGAFVGNESSTPKKEPEMTKTEKADQIIANGKFEEGDRAWLESLEDNQLDKMLPVANDENNDSENSGPSANDTPTEPAATDGQQAAPALDEETVMNALSGSLGIPAAQLKKTIGGLVANAESEKETLVLEIVTNHADCGFTKDELLAMELPQIKKIQAMAARPATLNYAGQGQPYSQGFEVNDSDDDEGLEIPTMNQDDFAARR